MKEHRFSPLLIISLFSYTLSAQTSGQFTGLPYPNEEATFFEEKIAEALETGKYFTKKNQLDSAVYYFHIAESALAKTSPTKSSTDENIMERQIETYDHLSQTFLQLERLVESMQYANQSLDLAIMRYGKNNPATSLYYRRLGDLYLAAGEHTRSIDYYHKAIFVLEKGNGHSIQPAENKALLGELYACLAEVYFIRQKPLSEVNALYEKSLVLVEKEDKKIAIRIRQLHKIGSIHLRESNPALARKIFAKADSIWNHHQATYGKEEAFQLLRAETIRVVGYSWKAQGEYEKAISRYKEYVRIIERLGTPISQSRVLQVLMEIGEIYDKLNSRSESDSSILYTQKALHKICRTFDSYDITQLPSLEDVKSDLYSYGILKQLARYHQGRAFRYGDKADKIRALKESLALLDLADELHSRHLQETTILRGGRMGGLLHGSMMSHDAGRGFAHRLYELEPIDSLLEKSFYYTQRLKAQKIWLARLKQQAYQLEDFPDSILVKEKELMASIHHYEGQIQQAREENDPSSAGVYLNDSLFHAKRGYESLVYQMEKNHPMYQKSKFQFNPTTLQEVREELRADEVVVEYTGDLSSIGAYIITMDQTPELKWLVSMEPAKIKKVFDTAKNLSQLLQNSIMQRKSSREKMVAWSHELYQFFIQPIEEKLAGKKKLVIIGDGATNIIPFEVLLPSDKVKPFDSLDYLIKTYEVSYHYSSTLFMASRKNRAEASSGLYAFAPVYDEQDIAATTNTLKNYAANNALRAFDQDGNYAPLPESEREVKHILGLFEQQVKGKHQLALRQEATEASLKTAFESDYRYVHIAGHSYADLKNPEFSGIACSGLGEKKEDGTLYAGEIYLLRPRAELVTLSSCESGLGIAEDNDGLLGLNRAFVYAGVPNVAFSLWKVYDKVSAALMVDFYTHILQGQSYSASLRAAKLRLLTDPATASPHFWGAYMLIGG